MKYLGIPRYDDLEKIRELSKKDNLDSFPMLAENLELIENEYEHYVRVNGDVTLLNPPLKLDAHLEEGLKADYSRNLKALAYIAEIRDELSPDVCPMCGSFGTGQADHFVPKKTYPEFSLFARNLVPACKCNQTKLTAYKNADGARILHPYFDKSLGERILYLEFSGDMIAPDMAIELTLPYKTNANAKYHVSSIVARGNVLNWASKEWSKIKARPSGTIFQKDNGNFTTADIKKMLEKAFLNFDRDYGTPNNWKSMFYYGLTLKIDYHEYIRDCVNQASS